MAFVGGFPLATFVFRVSVSRDSVPDWADVAVFGEPSALVMIGPDRRRPLDPLVVGDVVLIRTAFSPGRLLEQQQIVGQRRPCAGRVAVLRGERQAYCGCGWIGPVVFPDGDLAVEDPPGLLERGDDLAAEVGHAHVAVGGLGGGQLLDVDAGESAGLGDTQLLSRMMNP